MFYHIYFLHFYDCAFKTMSVSFGGDNMKCKPRINDFFMRYNLMFLASLEPVQLQPLVTGRPGCHQLLVVVGTAVQGAAAPTANVWLI